ncbi:MAG: hypothetical protein J1F68_06100 [Clostridiales bacterium]|nr:hypothetical protein [Clostridiales bacterium]
MKSNLITKKTIVTAIVLMLLALLFVVSAAIASTQTVAAAAEAEQQAAELQQAREKQFAQAEEKFKLQQEGKISSSDEIVYGDSEAEPSVNMSSENPVISVDELPEDDHSSEYDIMPIATSVGTDEDFRTQWKNTSVTEITLTANITLTNYADYLTRSLTLNLGGYTLNIGGRYCIRITTGGTLTLNGPGTITGASDNWSNTSPIQIKTSNSSSAGGTFIMNGGTISGNKVKQFGGAVYMEVGKFTMNNGTISGNSVTVSFGDGYTQGGGGGVYVGSGSFTMNGGTISNNTVKNGNGNGGGVFGSLTMKGGTISGNDAGNGCGGGVYGRVEMSGGTITENTAGSGGGIYSTGSSTISGTAIISNNTASTGGGMSINSAFTIKGGQIVGNTGTLKGAGVFVISAASGLTMSGGAITGNKGVGVYVEGNTSYQPLFTLSGGVIGNNTGNNVQIEGGRFIYTGGTIGGTSGCGNGNHTLTQVNGWSATCTAYGQNTYWYCTVCGLHFSNSAGTTVINIDTWLATVGQGRINKLSHSYGTAYQWNASQHWKVCTVCGTKTGTANHSYSNWTSANAGSHTGKCACGATSTVNHTLTTTANNNGTHTIKCSGCTYSSTVNCSPKSYTYGTDSSNHYLTCSVCNGKVNNAAHVWKYEKLNETSHRQYCSVCGKVGSASAAHGTLTNITTTNNGTHSGVCSVCSGSVTVECTPKNNGSYVQTTTGHYLECIVCSGKMNSGNHVYNGAYLGSDTDNIHYRECAVCSYRGDIHAAAASSYIYYDTNTHQGTCSVAGCGKVVYQAHNWSAFVGDSELGVSVHTRTCSCDNGVETHLAATPSAWTQEADIHYGTCGGHDDCFVEVRGDHQFPVAFTGEGFATEHFRNCEVCGYKQSHEAVQERWTHKNAETHSGKCVTCGNTVTRSHVDQLVWVYVDGQYHRQHCAECNYYSEQTQHTPRHLLGSRLWQGCIPSA